MSNRSKWVHRNRTKRRPDRARIPVGLASLVLGIVLFFRALEGMQAGIFMFPTFDFRAGSFGIGIGWTLGLLTIGAGLGVADIVILPGFPMTISRLL
jgi:hypothetical protein